MTVWLATVRDETAGVLLREVFDTKATAVKYLAKYCRDRWAEEGHENDPLPKADRAAVRDYFQFWDPEQHLMLARKDVITLAEVR